MRTSNVTGVSPAVADLSVAYLTLLEELYHLVSAYHAVTVQIQELTLSLRAVHRDLTESVTDQLQRMKTYSARITETIDALFPKLQSVMFMLHQVECASEIKNHLAHFNDSGVDAVVAKLPTLMADAASEIDQLYREADIEVSMLSNMNEIDRLLALKSGISEDGR
jgi:sugar-specific transcriptional regulator TrmB